MIQRASAHARCLPAARPVERHLRRHHRRHDLRVRHRRSVPTRTSKTASLSESCAARVRGRCIDPKDFSPPTACSCPRKSQALSRRLNLKKVALDGLIERELLDDEAKRLGIGVTDKEVTDQLYDGYIRVSVPAAEPAQAQQILKEMYQSYARGGPRPAGRRAAALQRPRHGHPRRLPRPEDEALRHEGLRAAGAQPEQPLDDRVPRGAGARAPGGEGARRRSATPCASARPRRGTSTSAATARRR